MFTDMWSVSCKINYFWLRWFLLPARSLSLAVVLELLIAVASLVEQRL